MTQNIAVLNPLTYPGSIEFKQKLRKYTSWALFIAAGIHGLLLLAYWGSVWWESLEEPPQRTIRIMKYTDLGPPPSIAGSANVAPSVSVASPTAKPSVGVPVPVPDAEVSPDQTLATQQEMSTQGAVGEGSGEGGAVEIEDDLNIEDQPPPDFVPFQKGPSIVKRVDPAYPEIARKAEIEGKVWAKVWIDKEGKIRQVVIIKSDSEIFNQAVIDAVNKWTFTPALMSTGPVAVWLSLPFVFKLNK
jgi:protein TonB